jgi:hypothetical protein
VDDPFQSVKDKKNNVFETRQGFRRRHPHDVLGRYAGLVGSTDSTSTVVEAAMRFEHERSEIPKENRPSDIATGLSTMYHVNDIALQNFKKSKNKLGNMHLVGV